MDMPVFEVGIRQGINSDTRLTVVFYLLAIVFSIVMVKPAHASGMVANTAPMWCANEYDPASCIYPTKEDACRVAIGNRTDYYFGAVWYCPGGEMVGYACMGYATSQPENAYYAQRFGWLMTKASCPLNSTPIGSTCTCTDPYVPDTTKTSCVQVNLIITLSGKNTMEPSTVLPFNVVVTDQDGVVQQGNKVTLKVEVQSGSGGHIHTENRPKGILSCDTSFGASAGTCTLTTDYSGQASFNFISTPVSGTHTITATCEGCGNTATAPVNVKVDNLIPIPASPYYALQDSAGNVIGAIKNKHSDNHYLTKEAIRKLKDFAERYNETVLPYAKLYLNDASLVWGGLFDVGSTPWTSPHEGHDRGMSVDIRAENSGGQYEGAVPMANFDDTIKVAAKAGARAALHCQGSTVTAVCLGIPYNRHFHVDF